MVRPQDPMSTSSVSARFHSNHRTRFDDLNLHRSALGANPRWRIDGGEERAFPEDDENSDHDDDGESNDDSIAEVESALLEDET